MNAPAYTPGDDELLMFHFGEDLGPERMQAIALAVAEDPRCAARYAELRRLLAASTTALADAGPASGFEQRVWRRLAPQLQPAPRPRPFWRDWFLPGLALAASLGLGIVIGRQWLPAPVPGAQPTPAPLALGADAGERLLAAHLARHLGRTERLLRAAENGDAGDAGDLAGTLIEGNRLYAAAAERAGKPALAQFLLELEPVLRELANADADALGGHALAQEQIRSRDLLFRLRALETLQTASTQRL